MTNLNLCVCFSMQGRGVCVNRFFQNLVSSLAHRIFVSCICIYYVQFFLLIIRFSSSSSFDNSGAVYWCCVSF